MARRGPEGTDGDPLTAKIHCYGRDFGRHEKLHGVPFYPHATAGSRLRGALREAGFQDGDVFFDNIVRAQPNYANDWSAHDPVEVARQASRLREDIARWKPAMILAVGQKAFHAVMGHHPDDSMLPPISDCRGYLFDSPLGPRVMPIVHPAAIDRRGDGGLPWVPYMKLLSVDCAKAWREVEAGCPALPERTVEILTDETRTNEYLASLHKSRGVALDIENDSELNLSCLGLAADDSVAAVIPAAEAWQLATIKKACEGRAPKVLQNGQYDRYFLKYKPTSQEDPARTPHYDIEIRNVVADTMLMWHCLPGWELVDTLRGPTPIQELVGSEFWVWSWKDGKPHPTKATALQTRKKAPLVRVSLLRRGKAGLRRKYSPSDVINPITIVCTPEHRFLTADDCWVEAQHLQTGDGLTRIGFNRATDTGRTRLVIDGKETPASHHILKSLGIEVPQGMHVHHKDEDPSNDVPENLEILTPHEHIAKHEGTLWTGEYRKSLPHARKDILGGVKRTPEELARLYNTGMSMQEIADVWNCGYRSVYAMMDRNNIQRRTLAEAQQLRREKQRNSRVLSVEWLDETADVYCLNVPETECFSVRGTIVHNSLQPELAGAREDAAKTKRMRRNTKKALKFLISVFLRDTWHKDYDFTSEEERYVLCGKDCCTTLAIAKILATELGTTWEEFLRVA